MGVFNIVLTFIDRKWTLRPNKGDQSLVQFGQLEECFKDKAFSPQYKVT